MGCQESVPFLDSDPALVLLFVVLLGNIFLLVLGNTIWRTLSHWVQPSDNSIKTQSYDSSYNLNEDVFVFSCLLCYSCWKVAAHYFSHGKRASLFQPNCLYVLIFHGFIVHQLKYLLFNSVVQPNPCLFSLCTYKLKLYLFFTSFIPFSSFIKDTLLYPYHPRIPFSAYFWIKRILFLFFLCMWLMRTVPSNQVGSFTEVLFTMALTLPCSLEVTQFVLMQSGFPCFPAKGKKGGLELPSGLMN